jgi:hypothetical protein
MAVIKDCSRVLPFIIPKDRVYTDSMLWHNDLHSDNIFVNEDCPTEITGIIDWQGVHLGPALLHVHYPSLIEYDGPILKGLQLPQLPPNFAELDPVAKADAQALHTAQSIWGLYQIFVQKQAPDLLRIISFATVTLCRVRSFLSWDQFSMTGKFISRACYRSWRNQRHGERSSRTVPRKTLRYPAL